MKEIIEYHKNELAINERSLKKLFEQCHTEEQFKEREEVYKKRIKYLKRTIKILEAYTNPIQEIEDEFNYLDAKR